jgi:Putative addiction module component
MASTLPLGKMTVEEKLQAMESLWDDLCKRAGVITSPAWHGDVLAEREAMHERGEDPFEDWEEAKRSINNEVS